MENEGVDNMGVGVGDIFTRIVGPIFCGKMGVKQKNLEFNSICLTEYCNENFKGAKQLGNKGKGGSIW